jgi:tRNA threonylcarbamoyladenosine biosynthesis protein TsaB
VIILAIESSTPSCSVALWVDSRIVAAREMLASGVAARKNSILHSQSLPRVLGVEAKNSDVLLGEIRLLLAQAGVSMSQLDAIAFGAGPGAFTGVRVACGVAQGIAMGCDIPVLLVNNLLCLAAQFEPAALNLPQSINVLSVLDARMGEAYLAGYCISSLGEEPHHDFAEIIAPQLLTQLANNPNAWPPAMFERSWHVVGSGVDLLPPQFAPYCATKSPHLISHAIEIAVLGAAAFKRGEAIDCAYAIPFYLRNNVAQTIEERRKSAAAKAVGVVV